jgi:hypothetical protein
MISMRTAAVLAALCAVLTLSVACAADVSINGTVVPKAAAFSPVSRPTAAATNAASRTPCGART